MAAPGGASGEDALIARYFKPLATDPGAFGLVDDAAILKASGEDIVVKTDAIVEGVHFLPDDPPDTIARKALRVNLSDLASKGATPAGFVLTLALRKADDAWLAPFARGLGEFGKIPGEVFARFRAQVDLAALAGQQAAKTVPFRLVLPIRPARDRVHGARFHRRWRRGFRGNGFAAGRWHTPSTQTAGCSPAAFGNNYRSKPVTPRQ